MIPIAVPVLPCTWNFRSSPTGRFIREHGGGQIVEAQPALDGSVVASVTTDYQDPRSKLLTGRRIRSGRINLSNTIPRLYLVHRFQSATPMKEIAVGRTQRCPYV
jgi:hypothetical protein